MDELMRSELRSLLDELRMIEDAMALLEAQQMALRDQISQSVAQLGGCAVIPGFGQLELVAPDRIISYDCHELDALMQALTITHPTIAARLRACRRESHRDDDLRITPAKAAAA